MPIMNYYYCYYYSMAGVDQRGQKGFQAFWDFKALYKNSLNSLYGRLVSKNTCTSKTQHRTETLIHNADENRKHLRSFQVVTHSMTAVIGCSFGIVSPCCFRSHCRSDSSELFS
jgi:hypothetical protein